MRQYLTAHCWDLDGHYPNQPQQGWGCKYRLHQLRPVKKQSREYLCLKAWFLKIKAADQFMGGKAKVFESVLVSAFY